MSAKEARKIVQFNNPKAKFVVTREMELRHLMYSERHVGEVLAIPDEIVGQLADLGMFNKNQGFQYMRRPVCMMRANTGLVARELFAQDVTHLGTKDRRVVVAGKGGNGKSFILLQMATLALLQNYVVVAVPRGIVVLEEHH
jgi:site-specific recombinase XerC